MYMFLPVGNVSRKDKKKKKKKETEITPFAIRTRKCSSFFFGALQGRDAAMEVESGGETACSPSEDVCYDETYDSDLDCSLDSEVFGSASPQMLRSKNSPQARVDFLSLGSSGSLFLFFFLPCFLTLLPYSP